MNPIWTHLGQMYSLLSHKSPFYLHLALATNPPKWDPVHSVRGVLYIPYAEIEEPFEAWYDSHTGRSRIDFYGGMVKTYQLAKECEFRIP